MIKLAVALVAAATLGGSLSAPAQAHHYTDTCGEVGLWDSQDRVAYKEAGYRLEALVTVANIPPYRLCGSHTTAQNATQHTSLHARSKSGGQCLELVAQRNSNGSITMWAYNCWDFSNGGTTHSISNYGHSNMYLYMNSGGSTSWSLWYYRYDTSQWVYMADVTREAKLVPWAESSGYNASSLRTTWFSGYTATNEFGTWNPPFTCPVSEVGGERHQAQVSGIGNLTYEENANTRCR